MRKKRTPPSKSSSHGPCLAELYIHAARFCSFPPNPQLTVVSSLLLDGRSMNGMGSARNWLLVVHMCRFYPEKAQTGRDQRQPPPPLIIVCDGMLLIRPFWRQRELTWHYFEDVNGADVDLNLRTERLQFVDDFWHWASREDNILLSVLTFVAVPSTRYTTYSLTSDDGI